MKFFKILFAKVPDDICAMQKNASGNRPDFEYELSLLEDCKRRRLLYINKMATLKIEEIDKVILLYEEHVYAFFSRGKVIICRIIAEKLTQLKRAREIVQKRIQATTSLSLTS